MLSFAVVPLRRILAIGYHDRTAPRHWTMSRAMLAEDMQVIECHTVKAGFFAKYRDLWRQAKGKAGTIDAVLVTFPGHYLMPIGWMIAKRKKAKLFFDAFISLSDTIVDDRERVSWMNPFAWFLYCVDWVSCHLADTVFIDTEAHRKFFIKRFGLKPERVKVVYLGTRTDMFRPKTSAAKRGTGIMNILFYGTYIPLQGVDVILKAMKILQDKKTPARLTLIGGGQTYAAMRTLAKDLDLKNATFVARVPYKDLPTQIRNADLCLGIFGVSDKAKRVIPHKVYDAVACGVPVITADTPAIREKFAKDPLVTLIKAGSPEALATAVSSAARKTR